MENELRRRQPGAQSSSPDHAPSTSTGPPSTSSSRGFGVIDVLRVLGGLLLLSSALSYFITNESLTWGWRPWFSRPRVLTAWMRGPVRLTDEELLAYDGSVEGRPIYVAVNGTIYDVSAGAKTYQHHGAVRIDRIADLDGRYGPGGSYHFFAGRDAARAYVTGCFDEDLTPDLRGVEEIYVPVDPEDDPTAVPMKRGELKIRREQDLRHARKQVKGTIEHWQAMFSGEMGKDYFKVGEIVREEDWLDKLPRRALCEKAKSQRPKRKKDGQAESDKKKKAKPKKIYET